MEWSPIENESYHSAQLELLVVAELFVIAQEAYFIFHGS